MRTDALIDRCVSLGLACIPREYPHAAQGMLSSPADVQTPRAVWPVFYGCYDWHSAVHNHWQLVRALRVAPGAAWSADVTTLLASQLRADAFAQEAAYLRRMPTFEMPYGIAWLLLLCAEVHALAREVSASSSLASTWEQALEPVHAAACENVLRYWRQLIVPNRAGAHANTAFAAGLMLDAARAHASAHAARIAHAIEQGFERLLHHAPRMHARAEPLGYDFVSPALCEADLARRVLPAPVFATWLTQACPDVTAFSPPAPAVPEDGQQSHFDGLNLSRAWMLRRIAEALPPLDARREVLLASAELHARAGLAGESHGHYSGQHWLGSFGMYVLTLDVPLTARSC